MDGITNAQLREATNAPTWLVDYLRRNKKLPLIKESGGRPGQRVVYDIKAINIVKEHLEKNKQTGR